MEVPTIFKLNRTKGVKKQRQRTKFLRTQMHRTIKLEKEEEPKMNSRNKMTEAKQQGNEKCRTEKAKKQAKT